MTKPPARQPPVDPALLDLGDQLARDPVVVAELLADPAGWTRAHGLGEAQIDRLRTLVTDQAAVLPPDRRRPLLAAAFALVRRHEPQGSSGPSTSMSSNRDDTPSLR